MTTVSLMEYTQDFTRDH